MDWGVLAVRHSFQIAPVISYAVNDRLALAAGPTITAGQIGVEPFIFESANVNGEYSAGRSSKYHWGGGFQIGSYYVVDSNWRLGASFKSKNLDGTFFHLSATTQMELTANFMQTFSCR